MIDWPDTSDIRHDFILTYTRNHDSYMTGVSLDSQREYYGGVFDAWLRKVKAEVWAEGFDAHDQDWKHHDANNWGDEDCLDVTYNPYED